ncbi:hypothetical protein RF11_02912 [Thelohanellus kitauei]|uniref:SCAN domain-containing protein 3 n=1 Tax=Thelohanellus kitauei TaxID=669202 RepID=A0A0C2JPU0_THEKT|nr:hypothetical protein RF11_02912 [Thelohanellus kitauei]
MTGSKSGLVVRVKQAAHLKVSNHCMIHLEALATNNINEDLVDALSTCTKIVNFIKARPLNHRLFENTCFETEYEHKHLLLHRKIWVARLACLADIFNILNSLNLSLQGPDTNFLKMNDKVNGLRKNIRLWNRRCETGTYDIFPGRYFDCYHCRHCLKSPTAAARILFEHYFGDEDVSEFYLIINRFECELTHLTGREQEQLAELSCDRTLHKAINVLHPSSTTYMCETGFYAVTVIKTQYRSRREVEHEIRICLSHIPLSLDRLCTAKQAQSSH